MPNDHTLRVYDSMLGLLCDVDNPTPLVRLTHVVPFIWRFHRVHHCDMNMDVSTANRFHIGELMISGLLRLVVIYTFGIPLMAYFLFEIMVNISVEFHHSSIKLNPTFEKVLGRVFMPPYVHRIHHSVKITP